MTILKKKSFPATDEPMPRESMSAEQYIDLTDMVFEDERLAGPEGAKTLVKVGEVFRYEDLSSMTNEVYNGNIVVIDFTSVANDDLAMRRITGELRNVARDTGGDVAGVGKNLIMVTPQAIKIDRNKIKSSF